MRISVALLVTLGLLLSLAACQGGPLIPTPTAIPLAATATPSSLPNSPTTGPSASATGTVPPMPPATKTPPTATAPASGYAFNLDERLAAATVRGFLGHLAAGNAASAFNLYLTDSAKAGEPGRMLTRFAEPEARLLDASLIEFKISGTSYRAQVELRWAGNENQGPATQPLTLVLRYQRGLWLVDEMVLGELQTATPTPTRAASVGYRSHPPVQVSLIMS